MPDRSDDATENAVPRDLDDFLRTLRERLAASGQETDAWTRCTSRRCRRARRCVDPQMRCASAADEAPMTPDETAAINAALLAELRKRMAPG